jgi:HAD superfamily hydrolase (TIGR01549 family)
LQGLVDKGSLKRELIQVIDSSFSATGTHVSESFCHALYQHFSCAQAYTLYPDVHPCLNRLFAANITLGVISDFDERLEGILLGLGIRSYFNFIVQSFVEGLDKPSRELWSVAVNRAGVKGEAWHVGDDAEKDAFVDATSILLDRHGIVDVLKITSLTQLPSILNISS